MKLKQSIPLKEYSNYKIGGLVKYFYEFKSKEDLEDAVNEYKQFDPDLKNVLILGEGTNILFSDDVFDGLVLKDSIKQIDYEQGLLIVSSGVLVSDLNEFLISNAFSGLEWSGGLPGSVGGAVRGNAGAHGGEIKDNIVEVVSYDYKNQKIIVRDKLDCKFDYRDSVFKSGGGQKEVILSVKFKLNKGDEEIINKNTIERINFRKRRHPLEFPNLGSTFKNVPVEEIKQEVLEEFSSSIKEDPFPVVPVAKIIAESGLVARRVGDAMISDKHPNFIVNLGNAKSKDVKDLIRIVKDEISKKYEIQLEEEIAIL